MYMSESMVREDSQEEGHHGCYLCPFSRLSPDPMSSHMHILLIALIFPVLFPVMTSLRSTFRTTRTMFPLHHHRLRILCLVHPLTRPALDSPSRFLVPTPTHERRPPRPVHPCFLPLPQRRLTSLSTPLTPPRLWLPRSFLIRKFPFITTAHSHTPPLHSIICISCQHAAPSCLMVVHLRPLSRT
jgi:hypothetical protein